jgi:acyl-CoA synthetase (AMP-forming)/AMP-acid ligase II
VVLSHRNMVAGAKSVASYLGNHAGDTLLAALPLSFDAGFSQLTTAFHVGARVVLLNYLLPRDVLKAMVSARRSPASRPCRRCTSSSPSWTGRPRSTAPALLRQHRRAHAARDAERAAPARAQRPSPS